MLVGETAKVDALCEQLGVVKSSWFLRELVLAQVIQATKFSDERFERLIPQLLNLLSDNLILRDRGLIHLLDRYAKSPNSGINEPLRNASVDWWGNPWLPSNETRWGDLAVNAKNSLKRSNKILWMQHTDGIKGWSKWEEMFAETLKQHFNIHPDISLKVRKATVPPPAPSPEAVTPKRPEGEDGLQSPKDQAAQQLSNSEMRFSTDALRALAREYSLEVDDHRDKNGNLWVRADNENRTLSHILTSWGFKYKALKGWWR